MDNLYFINIYDGYVVIKHTKNQNILYECFCSFKIFMKILANYGKIH